MAHFESILRRWLTLGLVLPAMIGCTHNTSATNTSAALSVPLGSAVPGATLSGPLAGKTLYYLGGGANLNNCWMDSEYWDGTTLWYGITAVNYTKLSATSPSYSINSNCALPSSQVGAGAFNIYSAVLQNGAWVLTNLPFNSSTLPYAAPKVSGTTMAFVSYEKTASDLGNIYLTTKTGANTWTTPVAFSLNSSACDEDNPDIYASGTKMIFESNRTTAAASSCNASGTQQLWQSSLVDGVWQTPTKLVGAPASAVDAVQPWLDESTGILYYSGDASVCPNSAADCILETQPSGTNWSTSSTVLITPTALQPGTADGKLVFIGQYTQANGYAFASCAVATETDPTGSTPSLYLSRWTLNISACVVPLN